MYTINIGPLCGCFLDFQLPEACGFDNAIGDIVVPLNIRRRCLNIHISIFDVLKCRHRNDMADITRIL